MAGELQVVPARLHSLMRRVAQRFVAGVLVILPVAITVGVITWVADFLRRLVGPATLVGDLLTHFGLRFVSDDALAYAVGVVVVLAVIFATGVVAETGARRLVQRGLDAVLRRIPIVGSVYGTSQQVVSLLGGKTRRPCKACGSSSAVSVGRPARGPSRKYDDQAVLKGRTFVPEKY
jgi:uncharacterized membrane protein